VLHLLTMLAGVAVFPWLCLGFLLWMAWLEDSLPAAVRRSGRTPDPAPILTIPVDPVEPLAPAEPLDVADPVAPAVPGQRQASQGTQAAQASEVSRSTAPSLGGSTNR
jgi:hypothetical protein